MMKSSCSRIPHLLRAFAEKQAASPSTGLPRQRETRTKLSLNSRQRRFASVSPLSKPSSVPHRVSVARPPQKPRPTLSRGRDPDYGFEQPPPPKRSVWDTAYVFTAYGFAAVVGIYVVFVVVSYRRDVDAYNQRPDKLEQNADVSDRWKSTTRNFDWEVDSTEKMTLLRRKRRRLVREAYGDVLEVSVGTGRNMDLYDTRPYSPTEAASYGRDTRHMITSLTFNDQSEVMLGNAKKKWELSQSEKRAGDRFTGKVDFVLGDAGKPGVIRRPPGGFDTIVQSMGICSMTDPVSFLKTVGRLVRQPGEEIQNQSPKRLREEEDRDGLGGRIFLLEHGKAYTTWAWLNSYLDNSAAMHADRYGCWYNKDIGKIIDEAGLVVERIKRYHFGTVWEIVLRPAPPAAEARDKSEDKSLAGKGWLSAFWK